MKGRSETNFVVELDYLLILILYDLVQWMIAVDAYGLAVLPVRGPIFVL
jgi:hypothetical protein